MQDTNWKWTKAGAVALMLGLATAMPASAQTSGGQNASTGQSASSDQREDGRDWGWIGLLGLVGLAGLMRKREHNYGGNEATRRPT